MDHSKLKFSTRVGKFSGDKEKWFEWKSRIRSFFSLLKLLKTLEKEQPP